jgi:hypothetical protein
MSVYVYMDCDQMKRKRKEKGQLRSAQTSPNQTVINEQRAAAKIGIKKKGKQSRSKTCKVVYEGTDVIGLVVSARNI